MNDNNYPKRKPTRLRNFDYGTPGVYFITICTQNREKLLSEIIEEEISLPPVLTLFGNFADESVRQIGQRYPGIKVDNYIIMPNHIHLLLSVDEIDGRRDASPTVDKVIGWFKYNVTAKINAHFNTPGKRRFQRSFHDHIIRNEYDYERINEYIEYNYLKWSKDCFYVE